MTGESAGESAGEGGASREPREPREPRELGVRARIAAIAARAGALRGRTLGELAAAMGRSTPTDLRRHKGWVGRLVEEHLGVVDVGADGPDFPELGLELKTIPVRADGTPRESTWVCTAPIHRDYAATWETSRVRAKLARVLWVPVITDRSEVAARRFGAARLWSPSPADEAVLREDWEGLSEMMALGDFDLLDAQLGEALQIRPKAANAAALTWTVGGDGEWSGVVPRGFYLRARFTARAVAADGAFLP